MENQFKLLTFTRLGLTVNQAKVYLALFQSGLSTASKISRNSGVARSDVYRVVKKLEKLGLLERIILTPIEFRAISIQDAFAILIERRMKEISQLQATTGEILKKIKSSSMRIAPEEEETQFSMSAEQTTVKRKERTLSNVQKSFDAVASRKNPHSAIFSNLEGIAEALQRGIKNRIIIDKSDEEELVSNAIKPFEKYANFKIRYLPKEPKALISIFDKKEACICTCTRPVLKKSPTLWTHNSCLLAILQDCFETKWRKARAFKSKLN